MDDQRKDHIDPEEPRQRNRSKQLPTHNLPIDHVENIKSTNKGSYLPLANEPLHMRVTLHKSAHRKREQDQTEKSPYGLY